VRVLLAAVSAWFPLTSIPIVAHVDWRWGPRGEQLRVVVTPPAATTIVRFRRRRWESAQGSFTTPWLTSKTTVVVTQFTEARKLDATLVVGFARAGGYTRPYLPPPFTLRVTRR
jgi:hypothetical protein